MPKIDKRQITWAIQRMSRIINVWNKLDSIDRLFLLQKFRDEHPNEFWEAAAKTIHQFAEQNKLVEKYLLGELGGLDLEDFERHMWECSICFDRVKAGQEFTQGIKEVSAGHARESLVQRLKKFCRTFPRQARGK